MSPARFIMLLSVLLMESGVRVGVAEYNDVGLEGADPGELELLVQTLFEQRHTRGAARQCGTDEEADEHDNAEDHADGGASLRADAAAPAGVRESGSRDGGEADRPEDEVEDSAETEIPGDRPGREANDRVRGAAPLLPSPAPLLPSRATERQSSHEICFDMSGIVKT